jgi:mannitol/fructose-specific phosphotransferase system IIA component (Ntr-type)
MTIENYFKKEFCLPDLKAGTKEGAIREICAHLLDKGICTDKDKFIGKILDREKLGSTGVGEGVAIPHAHIDCLNGLVVGFARSVKGLDFESHDAKDVHLIFLVGSNPENLNDYLNVLADISSGVLDNERLRKKLIGAKDLDEIVELFEKYDFMKEKKEKIFQKLIA